MALSFKTDHWGGCSAVRAVGDPTLAEFLALLERIGVESEAWPYDRLLLDVRGVRSLPRREEHEAVGRHIRANLFHLKRVAAIVAPELYTGASEQAAQLGGMNLRVFTTENQALEWLLHSPDSQATPLG
jgi:hypothetical protein